VSREDIIVGAFNSEECSCPDAQGSVFERERERGREGESERKKNEEGSCPDGQGSSSKIQDEYSLTVTPETPTNLDEIALLQEQNIPGSVTTLVQTLPGLVNSCRESSLGSNARYTQDQVNRTQFTHTRPVPATWNGPAFLRWAR
jgi:hypothetical protein